jgi:hypothetical protein
VRKKLLLDIAGPPRLSPPSLRLAGRAAVD